MRTFINFYKVSPLLIIWVILVNLFLISSIILQFTDIRPLMPLTFSIIFTAITNIKAYQLINNY